jgi:hypothetical protein
MGTVVQSLPDDAVCPACGGRGTLDPQSKAGPGARQCRTCSGWFLDRDAAYHFLVDELGVDGARIGQLLAAPGQRTRVCAACEDQTNAIVVRRCDVDLCGRCGAAFLLNEDMRVLSEGRLGGPPVPDPISGVHTKPPRPVSYDEPSLPPAPLNPFGDPETSGPLPIPPGFKPPPPTRSSPGVPVFDPLASNETMPSMPRGGTQSDVPTITEPHSEAPVSTDASASSSGLRRLRVGRESSVSHGDLPAASSASSLPSASSSQTPAVVAAESRKPVWIAAGLAVVVLLGVGGWAAQQYLLAEEREVDAPKEQDEESRYAKYLRHYPFGGRTVAQWSEALNKVRPGGPAENRPLYSIAKQRAERMGLVVEEEASGMVVVDLGKPLITRLLAKLEER